MNRVDKILYGAIAVSFAFAIFSFLASDMFDDMAEKEYILNSDPCGLTNYIEEGKKEQTRTFASFSFNYNNETGDYDSERISFTISKELVPLAELRYFEECTERNEK